MKKERLGEKATLPMFFLRKQNIVDCGATKVSAFHNLVL